LDAGAPATWVYLGSTPLSFQVFGRHVGRGDPLRRCGFARPAASGDDTGSTLV